MKAGAQSHNAAKEETQRVAELIDSKICRTKIIIELQSSEILRVQNSGIHGVA